MKNMTKILSAVAVAGLLTAGSSAFTAAGLSLAGSQQSVFVGGSVTQTVEGAHLGTIVYDYFSVPDAQIDGITLTFTGTGEELAELDGRTVTVDVGAAAFTAPAVQISCTAVASAVSTCSVADVGGTPVVSGYVSNLSALTVTVVSGA